MIERGAIVTAAVGSSADTVNPLSRAKVAPEVSARPDSPPRTLAFTASRRTLLA
jgi:hypothetical protein